MTGKKTLCDFEMHFNSSYFLLFFEWHNVCICARVLIVHYFGAGGVFCSLILVYRGNLHKWSVFHMFCGSEQVPLMVRFAIIQRIPFLREWLIV